MLEGLASKELELGVARRFRMGKGSPPREKQIWWLGRLLGGRGALTGWWQPQP